MLSLFSNNEEISSEKNVPSSFFVGEMGENLIKLTIAISVADLIAQYSQLPL